MLSRKTKLNKRLNTIKNDIAEDRVDAWIAMERVEKFILENKKDLTKYPDVMENVNDEYLQILNALSYNLGQISRQLFVDLDDIFNTKSDSRAPRSHHHCANASENITIQIVNEILSKKNINHRVLIVMRYAMIAKMRLNQGDYQSAEFIAAALSNPAISATRLKRTYAGLPTEIIELINSLELIAIKSDSHVMTYRTKPVIPSLSRIKKLMTFASDELVDEPKRQFIQEMLVTIQHEVKKKKVRTSKDHLTFFTLDELKQEPEMGLDEFTKEMCDLSKEIEKRDDNNNRATLFENDFTLLSEFDLSINIDEKINTFLEMKEAHRTLKALHHKFCLLIDELKEVENSQPDTRVGAARRKEVEKIIDRLTVAEEQARYDHDIHKIDDIILFLDRKADKDKIKGHYLHGGFKRLIDSTTLADKLVELISILNEIEEVMKEKNKIEKKYKKVEKKYKEVSVYEVKLNDNISNKVDDLAPEEQKNESELSPVTVSECNDSETLFSSNAESTDSSLGSTAIIIDLMNSDNIASDQPALTVQQELGEVKIVQAVEVESVDPELSLTLPAPKKYLQAGVKIKSLVNLFDARVEAVSAELRQLDFSTKCKDINALIKFFDRGAQDHSATTTQTNDIKREFSL